MSDHSNDNKKALQDIEYDNIYLKKLFPYKVQKIRLNDLIQRLEAEHGRFLGKLFLKEWEIIKGLEIISEYESEHSHDLGIVTSYEIQKKMLEDLNKRLTATAIIHERDLKMAANVQESFLFEKPPFTNNFDIAFYYKPTASLSGDFYDFYIDRENNLYGLILVDVSGHGIASSLLTVLSKPIFYNFISRYREKPLGMVVEEINKRLIDQIENSEYYLTGVLLRFKGDMVEYVNAGHPDIIFKRAGAKNCRVIESLEKKYRSSFLGVSILAMKPVALEFSINRGDVFVLYTDCLLEGLNPRGEQFGKDNILHILNEMDDNDSAALIAEKIYRAFSSHTKDMPQKDDLTIIVIKRKL